MLAEEIFFQKFASRPVYLAILNKVIVLLVSSRPV